MPGGSSTVPGDNSKTEPPAPLLGVAGQAGSVDQQDGIKDEQHSATHSAPSPLKERANGNNIVY